MNKKSNMFLNAAFFMKMAVVILALYPFLSSYSQVRNRCLIVVKNNLGHPVKEQVTEVPWSSIKASYPGVDTSSLVIIDKATQKQVVYQLERKGGSQVQNLLIQVSMPPRGEKVFELRKGKPQMFVSKTYARFVPERYEDFAWENDKVAFRMYGRALEATTFNAYGVDFWAKRTDKLVINKWYKSEDYHTDHGEGLDFYGVGLTLGGGGIAPYSDGQIVYSKNYVRHQVLDNGPLRSSFTLFYEPWMVDGNQVNYTKTVQLDAGSQLNKFVVTFSSEAKDSIDIVAGIHENKGKDVKFVDEQAAVIGYWEPKNPEHGTIGIGCVYTGNLNFIYSKDHLLALERVKTGQPFTYYAGGCWDKAGKYTQPSQWFNYLQTFSKTLNALSIQVR